MTLPSKPVMVRIPAELVPRFEALKQEFPGIPQAMVLRFILTSVFERSLDEQIEIINAQIRGAKESKTVNRIERLNTKQKKRS